MFPPCRTLSHRECPRAMPLMCAAPADAIRPPFPSDHELWESEGSDVRLHEDAEGARTAPIPANPRRQAAIGLRVCAPRFGASTFFAGLGSGSKLRRSALPISPARPTL